MRRSRAASRGRPTPLQPRVKVWLEAGGRYAFGFGVCEMLQAVDRQGSMKRAAAELGKSYRYVWGRIKEAEASLGRQLVETHVGGKDVQRSLLTPEAKHLVAHFLALREEMTTLLRHEFVHRFH